MNACKKFSSYAEDIQKSLDLDKEEAVLMIGAFPENNELVFGMFGRGLEIMTALCCAFDSNPKFKEIVKRAILAHDMKMLDDIKERQDMSDVMKAFTKCFDKKNRS